MVISLLSGTVLGSLIGSQLDQLMFVGSKGEGGTALGMLPGALMAFFIIFKVAKVFTKKKKKKLVPFLADFIEAIFRK
jgi:F0F1-type ATP synthase assembly protein I